MAKEIYLVYKKYLHGKKAKLNCGIHDVVLFTEKWSADRHFYNLLERNKNFKKRYIIKHDLFVDLFVELKDGTVVSTDIFCMSVNLGKYKLVLNEIDECEILEEKVAEPYRLYDCFPEQKIHIKGNNTIKYVSLSEECIVLYSDEKY